MAVTRKPTSDGATRQVDPPNSAGSSHGGSRKPGGRSPTWVPAVVQGDEATRPLLPEGAKVPQNGAGPQESGASGGYGHAAAGEGYSQLGDKPCGERRLESAKGRRVPASSSDCGDPEMADLAPSGKSSFMQSLFNGVNVLAGIGILSTPYATAGAGWLSLILLLLFALACCYTGLLLRACIDTHPHIISYPDIGQAAFGNPGRWITATLLYLELYGVAVELLILEADNLSHMFPEIHVAILGWHPTPRQFFLLLTAAIVLPTVWLKDLSLLSYISASGVLTTILIVLGVAWIGVFGGVGFTHSGLPLKPAGLPAAAGLFGFCFSGHAVFPNLFASMKDRSKFPKMLLWSFAVCFVLYGGIAACGYAMFGDDVQSQVTLNLPKHLIASHVVIWTTVINPFTKYALTIMPLAIALEQTILTDPESATWRTFIGSMFIRSALVASGVAVAALVPFFSLVMAFVGSLLSLSISVILPCLFHFKMLSPRSFLYSSPVRASVLLLGVVSCVAGTYYSVRGFIYNY